ncbi:hypothetical protein FO519_003368 [Halicephalobus sp. NKZ332]|nr:hypothetical protein FO519_003368 [Halicephalobus sp. NKZ332]
MERRFFDYDGDPDKLLMEQQWLQMFNLSDVAEPGSPSLPSNGVNEEWFQITIAFCYGVLALTGLFFNCAFCFVIWRSKSLHSVTHMLMTNLASSNILFLLFHPPFFMSTYILQTNWIFGTIMCKASFSIVYVTATGSFYFMSLVAIDRWLAIFRRKSRLSTRKCIWLTAIVWLISFTVASPYLYLSGEVHVGNQQIINPSLLGDYPDLLPQDRVQCGIDCPSCKRVLQVSTIIAQYGVPLFVMIPTYGHLAVFLWRRPTVGVQSRERFRKAQHRRRRMLLTLLAIVGFLILCWSPLFSVGVLHAYKLINNDSLSIYIYTSMIALLGVVLTPCFYLLNDGFRKQILLIVPCCQLRSEDTQITKTTMALDNTSNMENVLQAERDYRPARQTSPLLPSGHSTKQSSVELTADIISYSPRRDSLEYMELPNKYSLSGMVQL